MKILKYSIALIWGLLIFSVFVTCVYAGGFVNVFQRAVGNALTLLVGLGLTAYGVIGVYCCIRSKRK